MPSDDEFLSADDIIIPPSRIPYFFYSLLPLFFLQMILFGQSFSSDKDGNLIICLFISGWLILVGTQLIRNKGGLTIEANGIHYRQWGKPDKSFDMRWDEIKGIDVLRNGIFLATCIRLSGEPRAAKVVAGNEVEMVTNSIGGVISSISTGSGIYRPIYWLSLSPYKIKEILDHRLSLYLQNN